MKHYFRHFKGGKYRLIAIGYDSENSNQRMVVYQALYGERRIWVRPYEMFFGEVNVNGVMIRRFIEISKEEAYDK